MTYYAERNGWVDDGKLIGGSKSVCPNCRSNNYTETLSREYCRDCGLECNYWGNGANPVYQTMMVRKAQQHEREREARFRKQYEEIGRASCRERVSSPV